jgi:protein O-GlcNAc transferase
MLQLPRRRLRGIAFLPLALVCAVAIRALAQVSPSTITSARQAMAAGLAAAKSGDLLEAKKQFALSVDLAPQIYESRAALGSVLLSLGEFKASADELSIAHTLAPSNTDIDLNLADAYASLGQSADAVKLFHAAITARSPAAFAPQDSILYATSLAATSDSAGAETALQAAVKATPTSPELHDALGTLMARRGAMEQALEQFRQAITISPFLIQAQYHLGVALLAVDQPANALVPLHLAATAQPQSFDAQLQFGRALSSTHQDAQALDALHRAAHLVTPATPSEALYALAIALQASGDAASALPFFESVTKAGLDTSAALTNYALALVQTGDARSALPRYARALAMGPDLPTLREDYGVAYLQQSDLNDATIQFRAGLVLDPNNAHLHYDLGLALKLKDDLASAVLEFERSAALDPTLPDPPYTLGVIYMQQGKFAAASTQLRKATDLQPSNGDAWALLGSVLKDSGDPSGATSALKHAIALQPDQPSLHIQLAALEVQAGNPEAAAADRKIAADLSRAVVSRQRASFALKSGRSLLADSKIDAAVTQLLVAIQADPTLSEPHRLLADAYGRLGRPADAALERSAAESLDRQSKR